MDKRNYDLKPCPFCGGDARLTRTKDISQYWYVECSACYARLMAVHDAKWAAAAWNERSKDGI